MEQSERESLAILSYPEQRRTLKSRTDLLCELCGKKAKYVIPRSLILCCVSRPDRCMNKAIQGKSCYGCGFPAIVVSKTGPVCGRHVQGCPELIATAHTKKGRAYSDRIKGDPNFRETVKQKHREALFRNHGVTSVTQLESWKTSVREKYGVDNPASSSIIKERKIANSLERHGVEHPSMLETTKERFRETCQERYGVDNPSQSRELEERWRTRYLEKNGVDHPTKTEKWKIKFKATMIGRWGMIWSKLRETLQIRYGVSNIINAPGAKEKRIATFLTNYGVDNVSKDPRVIVRREKSNLAKYGCRYPIQNPTIYHKTYLPGLFRKKLLVLPSGREVVYQGYEHLSISRWLDIVDETSIKFNGEVGLSYGDRHTYYPDLVIPVFNLVIEVKSPYTLWRALVDGSLINKLEASESVGYAVIVECWTKTGELREYTLQQLKNTYLEVVCGD